MPSENGIQFERRWEIHTIVKPQRFNDDMDRIIRRIKKRMEDLARWDSISRDEKFVEDYELLDILKRTVKTHKFQPKETFNKEMIIPFARWQKIMSLVETVYKKTI